MEGPSDVDIEDVESEKTENSENSVLNESINSSDKPRLVKLPLTRIKHIMKLDPDCSIISQDAVFLVTKSAELFVEHLAKESLKFMGQSKRKTVQKKDVDAAIDNVPSLCFLDGALE